VRALIACVVLCGCGAAGAPRFTAPQTKCLGEAKARQALELASCGDDVSGPCATDAIMDRSLERSLACLEK
jgi:hypothetical protein